MSAQCKEPLHLDTALADDSEVDMDRGAEALIETKVTTGKFWRARFALLAVAVAAAVVVVALFASGGAPVVAEPQGAVTLDALGDAQAQLTNCVIDADQAVFYLIQAGVYIRIAVENCKDTSDVNSRTACAASITTVLASVGWVTSYTASTLNSCGTKKSVKAACASSMGGIFAELGEFAFIASSIASACDINDTIAEDIVEPQSAAPVVPHPSPAVPRIKAKAKNAYALFKHWSSLMNTTHGNAQTPQDPLRAAFITQTIVDLNLGLTYLGRLGTQIYYLTQQCPSSDENDQKDCSLNIFNAFSSIGWAAQFLAQVAVDCPAVSMVRAGCAAVVSDFVAVVAALGPLVNGVSDDCHLEKMSVTLPPGYADFE